MALELNMQVFDIDLYAAQDRAQGLEDPEPEVITPDEGEEVMALATVGEPISGLETPPFYFEGHGLQVLLRGEEWWFIAAQVCAVLELSGSPGLATRRLDDDEKGLLSTQTLGGKQEILIVSESGLYELIMTSRKPEAKQFKRWIRQEVLPTLRKTGSYQMQPQRPPTPTELAAQMVRALEAHEERIAAVEVQQAQLSEGVSSLEVRTGTLEGAHGELWFVAIDACTALGIKHAQDALNRLSEDEKDNVISNDAIGRQQQINIISETGLYQLTMTSRKPHQLRRQGVYQ